MIAAGERWPDQSLRPAIEDWLGAGAVIAAIAGDPDLEAATGTAAASFRSAGGRLADVVRDSRSGRELGDAGHGHDVDVALEVESSGLAPFLRDGAHTAGR